MNNRTQSILDELYALDPKLREREAELIPLVEQLIASRPDTEFDQNFYTNLRRKILHTPMPQPSHSPFLTKLLYIGSGSFIALILAVPLTHYLSQTELRLPTVQDSVAPQFAQLGDRAFGDLGGTSTAPETYSTTEDARVGFGGGRQGTTQSSELTILPDDWVAPVRYTFTYTGNDLDLETPSGSVYRRIKHPIDASRIESAASGLNAGPFNLSTFPNLNVQNLDLTQGEGGYIFSVNTNEGSISFSRHYGPRDGQEIWKPFTIEERPSKEAAIAIAQNFVNQHNIDVSGFGTPTIDDRSWNTTYEENGKQITQEIATITYPHLINGEPVWTEEGAPAGLYIYVNLRNKQVNGGNLNIAQRFDASTYGLTTDTSQVLKFAEQGGRHFWQPEKAEKTVELELGTPTQILSLHYQYKDGETQELYVPALSFPILNAPEDGNLFRTRVIIPLVKDILDETEADRPIILPVEPFDSTEPAVRPQEETSIQIER